MESYPTVTTATAPALSEIQETVPRSEAAAPTVERTKRPVTFQRTLFREVPNVMPAPEGFRPAATPRAPRPQQRPGVRRNSENQQALDFHDSPARHAVDARVEAVIFCDATAASPTHRLLAAVLDGSLVVTAMGLFVASFAIGGGEMILDKHTVPAFAGIAAVLWFFYQFLFCLGGGDTPGMQWTQLRLVNFDGQRPDREQRLRRLFATCLSVVAAFLGVIWALVDEESLTWHDHISKTFPTADRGA
jgi:uncharacterized RDD family membrane protein YckC